MSTLKMNKAIAIHVRGGKDGGTNIILTHTYFSHYLRITHLCRTQVYWIVILKKKTCNLQS